MSGKNLKKKEVRGNAKAEAFEGVKTEAAEGVKTEAAEGVEASHEVSMELAAAGMGGAAELAEAGLEMCGGLSVAKQAPSYVPSRLIASFCVAGFKNYDGYKVLGKLKPGKKLTLVPEPSNPYDPNAVRIERKGVKLGYVPKDENSLVSLLSFYGHGDAFECRVQQVDLEAAPWQQLRVGIFVTDAR